MRAVLEVFLGLGLTCMLLSNLHDSACATSLDFPGGPLAHDEQLFLKDNMGTILFLLDRIDTFDNIDILDKTDKLNRVLDKFLLFGLAANDAWNDDKKTDEGDAPQCYR